MVVGNRIEGAGDTGLGSYRDAADPGDNNVFNVFRNSRISGNAGGGCCTTAARNTFFGNGPQPCAPPATTVSLGGSR